MPMPYSWQISQRYPTCSLFRIDQSESMLRPMGGATGRSKAESVAESINQLLYNLVLRCVKGASVLDRFHVGVIGYGSRVGPAFGGQLANRDLVTISEIARYPLRVEERQQENPDGTLASVRFPVWFEPQGDGKTPMCAAFPRPSNPSPRFPRDHAASSPPTATTAPDGNPTGGTPERVAGRLRHLSSTAGPVLLFTLPISEKGAPPIEFPDREADLPDVYAKL